MELQNCRNAIEELVIDEVKSQTKSMTLSLQKYVDTNAVVTYSLNRLPTMYATTQRGWAQQRRRAREELKDQITGAVRQGIMGTRKDLLRLAEPLPLFELETEARALANLQKIFNRSDLRWRDLQSALQEAVANIYSQGSFVSAHQSMAKRNAMNIKSYLRRSKSHAPEWKNRQIASTLSQQSIQTSQDEKEFASYMVRAYWDFTNILENLVMAVAELQLKRMEPSAKERVTLNEVVAYSLNRLPAMYATSNQGLQQLRTRAKTEMAHQIVAIVRQAVLKVGDFPQRLLPPLTIEKYTKERHLNLSDLSHTLGIELTWQNVVETVENILIQTEKGDDSWYKKLQGFG